MGRRFAIGESVGAFGGCKWCFGRGCLQCAAEAEKAQERAMKPILTANRDDPRQMEDLKSVIGGEALQRAFGPGGGGVREVEFNAATVNLLRALRRPGRTDDEEEDEHGGE